MLPVTAVFIKLFGDESDLARDKINVLRTYMTAAHDDEIEEGLFESLLHMLRNSGQQASLNYLPPADLRDSPPLLDFMDEDWSSAILALDGDPDGLRSLPCFSVVGLSCLRAILKADLLISDLPDARDVHYQIRYVVARQCRVWLHG